MDSLCLVQPTSWFPLTLLGLLFHYHSFNPHLPFCLLSVLSFSLSFVTKEISIYRWKVFTTLFNSFVIIPYFLLCAPNFSHLKITLSINKKYPKEGVEETNPTFLQIKGSCRSNLLASRVCLNEFSMCIHTLQSAVHKLFHSWGMLDCAAPQGASINTPRPKEIVKMNSLPFI